MVILHKYVYLFIYLFIYKSDWCIVSFDLSVLQQSKKTFLFWSVTTNNILKQVYFLLLDVLNDNI